MSINDVFCCLNFEDKISIRGVDCDSPSLILGILNCYKGFYKNAF